VEIIWVSGRVAKLTVEVTRHLNKAFRWLKTGKFSEIADILFGLCEDCTSNKDHGCKMNYRPCFIRNFEATGAAGENLRPFSFGGWDRLLRPSTQPWEVYIGYRGSKLAPPKLTEMAVNRLKYHTWGKKTLSLSKIRRFLFKLLHFHRLQKQSLFSPYKSL